MPEPLWKKVQREHLKRMGGQGRTAWRGEYGPDSIPLPWLVVDSKSVKELPKRLTEAVETIVEQATTWAVEKLRHLNENVEPLEDYRLGVVRYHVTGTKYSDDLIVIRAGDFEEAFLKVAAKEIDDEAE